MMRRTFLELAAAGAAAASLPRRALAATEAPWRTFEVVTRVEVLGPTGVSRAWIPLPLEAPTDWQKRVGDPAFTTDAPTMSAIVDEASGASMFFAEWPAEATAPVAEVAFQVQTRDRAVDLSAKGKAPAESKATLAKYLAPSKLITTDGIVRERATEVAKGARTDVEKARAIYQWIVDNTFRDPQVRGCGLGDIAGMLTTGNLGGKCADLNALFVGMARSVGVPARDLYGLRVAPSATYSSLGKTGDVTKGQHCRAEFYAAGYGWVPVDPADVRKLVLEENGGTPLTDPKVATAREHLFGGFEMNWFAYNDAHDVALPHTTQPPLPFFMYPQVESGGVLRDCLDAATVKYSLTSREITA